MKTMDYIKELRDNGNKITKTEEETILKCFGETIRNEFTEKDVWEYISKVIFESN